MPSVWSPPVGEIAKVRAPARAGIGIIAKYQSLPKVAQYLLRYSACFLLNSIRIFARALQESWRARSGLLKLFLTLFPCDLLDNETFRRELLRILNHGESTHTLLRAIHSGNLTAARGRRHEELTAISGSLTLLANLTLAWITHQMQSVLDGWRRESGRAVDPSVLKHIGPGHIEGMNFRGTLNFPTEQYLDRLIRRPRGSGRKVMRNG